jgi:hypothetical protein
MSQESQRRRLLSLAPVCSDQERPAGGLGFTDMTVNQLRLRDFTKKWGNSPPRRNQQLLAMLWPRRISRRSIKPGQQEHLVAKLLRRLLLPARRQRVSQSIRTRCAAESVTWLRLAARHIWVFR